MVKPIEKREYWEKGLMYRSFSIRNFRCFRDFTIGSLKRVNLIAGMNNVGKTALLEALFLSLGPTNPQLPLRVNILRGLTHYPSMPEELWGWLFLNKGLRDAIELRAETYDGEMRTLRIVMKESVETTISEDVSSTGPSEPTMTHTSSPELRLEYYDSDGKEHVSRAFFSAKGELKAEQAQVAALPVGVFLTGSPGFGQQDAERFSDLEKVGRQDEVLETLQIIEPRLKRLAVLATRDQKAMIHGDIGLGELVPVPFMGQGTGRFLTILLAVLNAPRGTVLVDEVENGLHHSRMPQVWCALNQAARRADAQLFATTHSWECVGAAHEAFRERQADDLGMHRLERVNGEIRDVAYEHDSLDTALKAELEIR